MTDADSHKPPPDESPAGTLGQRTLSGVRWMGLTRIVAETVAFAASIALARLIAPDEFGRVAVALFVGIVASEITQGLGAALVAHRSPTRRHFQAALFLALVAGTAGTLLTLLFAATAAAPIFGDRAAELIALSSPTWLLAALVAGPMARIQRELRFGRLSLIQTVASLGGPIVAVTLAVAGLGGEAIVVGGLTTVGITALLGWLLSPVPAPRPHAAEMREIAHFSGPASGSSLLYAATRNVDYLLLAAFVPAFQVGLYMRAFTLGTDYQSKISQVLLSVAFPVLSRAKDLDDVRRMRARMVRVHATVLFPLLFGLIAIAPEFVPWMYGARWEDAGHLTQILAVGGLIAVVATGTGPLLLATGRAHALLVYNAVAFVVYALAVLATVSFGVTAVCVAVVGATLLTFLVMQYLIVERQLGIPVVQMLRDDVLAALVAGIPLMLVTMLGLRAGLELGVPVALSMFVPGLVGLGVYVLILRTFFAATWRDVTLLFSRLSVGPMLRSAVSRARDARRVAAS